MMTKDMEIAREYAQRLQALLEEARQDGFVFGISGGRRTPYKLTATVLPQTFELEPSENQPIVTED